MHYVKQWGPLFGWSCFGFEDGNAKMLRYSHGTGDVTKTLITMHHAHLQVSNLRATYITGESERNFVLRLQSRFSKKWKVSHSADNCSISGAIKDIKDFNVQDDRQFLLTSCGVQDQSHAKKCLRVHVGEENFYGNEYTKLKRHNCSTALNSGGNLINICYFLLNTKTNLVYAVGWDIQECDHAHIFAEAVWDIAPVQNLDQNLYSERGFAPRPE